MKIREIIIYLIICGGLFANSPNKFFSKEQIDEYNSFLNLYDGLALEKDDQLIKIKLNKIRENENKIVARLDYSTYIDDNLDTEFNTYIRLSNTNGIFTFKEYLDLDVYEMPQTENTSFIYEKIYPNYLPSKEDIFSDEEYNTFFKVLKERKAQFKIGDFMALPVKNSLTGEVYMFKYIIVFHENYKKYMAGQAIIFPIEKYNGKYYLYKDGIILKESNSFEETLKVDLL